MSSKQACRQGDAIFDSLRLAPRFTPLLKQVHLE